MPLPAEDGFFMPAEWARHSRCWMAWPCREALWGERLDAAREGSAEVAKAIAEFEPVTMIANPENVAEASLRCGSGVACLPMAHDDSWLRDTAPTFVIDGRGRVAGVDWRFNAWGNKYERYERDAATAGAVLEHLDLPRYAAPLVLEGGAIHVDGEGTLLTSEQCLLNPNRNPDLDRAEIERLLAGHLGIRQVIWLGQGLEDDETDGHVDNLACFVKPGAVLALSTDDPEDPNYPALQDNLKRLRAARDAKGRELEVVAVNQPARGEGDDGKRLAKSYVNFYIANGGVVMPTFEDAQDEPAFEILAKCFPEREVRRVSAVDIVHGGGGVHCITQQQPAGEVAQSAHRPAD
ncbi:MAG: agmatine/peptidylarginine deiminase [Kiloniellaceae bacterium]